MKYLVDANVLSEPAKPIPSPQVIDWLRKNERDLALNPIILEELEYGKKHPLPESYPVIKAPAYSVPSPWPLPFKRHRTDLKSRCCGKIKRRYIQYAPGTEPQRRFDGIGRQQERPECTSPHQ